MHDKKRLYVMFVAACCAVSAAWAKPVSESSLKIMSFNVRHCEGMDGRIDVARTAARIRAENPDFACLQEIDRRTTRTQGIDQPYELGRLTGLHATFAKAIPYRGGEYGLDAAHSPEFSREYHREVSELVRRRRCTQVGRA